MPRLRRATFSRHEFRIQWRVALQLLYGTLLRKLIRNRLRGTMVPADMSFIFSRHVDWPSSFPDFYADSLQKPSHLSIVAHCLRNPFPEPSDGSLQKTSVSCIVAHWLRKPFPETWRRFFTENICFMYCKSYHLDGSRNAFSEPSAGSLQKTTVLSIDANHFPTLAQFGAEIADRPYARTLERLSTAVGGCSTIFRSSKKELNIRGFPSQLFRSWLFRAES